VVAAAIVFSLWRTVGKGVEFQKLDFGASYRGALAVSHGETPYVVDEHGPLGSYIYGPAFAFLCQPLCYLDYIWACRVWMLFYWGLTICCFAIALHLAFPGERRTQLTWMAFWLTAITTSGYFWSAIRVGQTGLLMVTLCLAWAHCHRNARPFLGGIFLAGATLLKLAPGFLIPYLLVRRSWRGLAGVAVGGLVLFLVPAPWMGLDGAIRLHQEWAAHCRNTQIVEQTYRPENQSLIGQLARLPPISNGHDLIGPEALHALGRFYPLVILGFGIVLHGAIWWSQRKTQPSAELENLHIAILLVAMTLLNPRAWTCNFVSLVVPCALLARAVTLRAFGWRSALVVLTMLSSVCAASKVGRVVDWSFWRWVLQGKDFWIALALISVCGWCHLKSKPRAIVAAKRPALAA
jgi:hypothetical protein